MRMLKMFSAWGQHGGRDHDDFRRDHDDHFDRDDFRDFDDFRDERGRWWWW